MSLTKVNYIDNSTIITAQNLNDIQDNIIELNKLEDKIIYGKGKNLLKRTITGYNSVGIVATVNPDGSVTLNGTSTNSTRVRCGTAHLEGGKTYVINGRPTGGEVDDYRADLRDSTGSTTLATDAGAGATYTPQADMDVLYIIRVGAGAVFTGQTFYPMIRLASETDDTYEPYYEGLMESVSKSQVVNNFTTTEEGFVADARALKMLNDGICDSIAFFSVGSSNDGRYYYCTIKNLRTSDVAGRTPFVVLIPHQNQNPILATVMLSSKGIFKTSSERITYADGTLTIDCGYSAYASPLIIYPRNYFEFS